MQDADALLRSYRKKLLFDPGSLPVRLDAGRQEIEKIIPHRDPLLFVDRLVSMDRGEGLMVGERFIDPDDPVFKGHFPGSPLYPGNFTLEMIGQLGLCMYYFHAGERDSIDKDAAPVPARATRVAGAYYLEPVMPGSTVQILAKKLSFDGYFASMIGQAVVNGKVAVVAIGEVIILGE